MPESPKRTALYRLYGTDDVLLYVGISTDPTQRLKKHRWTQHWGDLIVRQSVEWLDTWDAAELAERETVKAERPIYNGTHNHPAAPFVATNWPTIEGRRGKVAALVALILKEIDQGRWKPGMMIPKSRDLATATGVSRDAAVNAIRELDRAERLKVVRGVGVFVYDGSPINRPNYSPMAARRAQGIPFSHS
ncbi:GntR family transcriptional regulator [Streptomyces sp. NPDC006640]|uniref:GntR family transcriptional regulator n=1 Tax=unclassified Streptomyces TaxID=2593676 RepID=UPI003675FEC5